MKSSVRINIPLVCIVLAHVSRHQGVNNQELKELTETSLATLKREIRSAREYFGIVLEWRSDMTMPSRGEYSVKSWGALRKSWVLENY